VPVVPHIRVHRRRKRSPARRGEVHRCEEVVRYCVGEFRQDVGGGAGATERVSGLCSIDVLNSGGSVRGIGAFGGPKVRDDLVPVRAAKVSGAMNCCAAAVITTWTSSACFCRSPNQLRRFVGSGCPPVTQPDLHGNDSTLSRRKGLSRGERGPTRAYEANFGMSAPFHFRRTVGAFSLFT